MGYDMQWSEPATEEERARLGEDAHYFRLNIWGMAEAQQAMCELGMIAPIPFPAIPRLADFGLEEAPAWYDKDDQPIDYPIDTPQGRYQRACLTATDGDTGGLIPVYKLTFNSGWRVAPEEISRSLAVYESRCAAGENPPRTYRLTQDTGEVVELSWWGEWIDWLRGAAQHGGFNVY
jgi:hypothetical protein